MTIGGGHGQGFAKAAKRARLALAEARGRLAERARDAADPFAIHEAAVEEFAISGLKCPERVGEFRALFLAHEQFERICPRFWRVHTECDDALPGAEHVHNDVPDNSVRHWSDLVIRQRRATTQAIEEPRHALLRRVARVLELPESPQRDELQPFAELRKSTVWERLWQQARQPKLLDRMPIA
ncbi:MAG: hypothetical protein WD771_09330 [Gemmatimonadaceae bacterium]